jgi:aminopeptidase N
MTLINRLMFIFFAFASLIIYSCTASRFSDFGYTPIKPGHYNKFTPDDYLMGWLDGDRAGYDVTFYDLDLKIDPANLTIGGEAKIYFKALNNLGNIRFDLDSRLKINSLIFSGEELPYKREGRAVTVSLPDPLVTGRSYSFVVGYQGQPARAKNPPWSGGVVWKKDSRGNPWVGVACETEGASIWFPCKDHISDEPDSVRLRISVPGGLEVVSNGIMENHTSAHGQETYTWYCHYPINIYNITFYTGKFEHFSDTMMTGQGILNLDYYVMPENLQKAKEQFKQVKDVIKIFSNSFGPYPWIKDGYKLVEGPFSGMEHQSAIAYGSRYVNWRSLGGDPIIVHETAHEWWGNAVSVSDFSDIWLQEGFATYSEMIFAESVKDYKSSLLYARRDIAGMINNRIPVVGPPDVNFWDKKDNDVYNKGAMILNTIRNIVNDSALFFNILQTFYREHAALSHVTTADFKELIEGETGKDWSKFFEAYLYRREVPVLRICYCAYNSNNEPVISIPEKATFIIAKWTNVPDGFTMPIDINCKENNGSAIFDVSTKATGFNLDKPEGCNHLILNGRLSYYNTEIFKKLPQDLKKEFLSSKK